MKIAIETYGCSANQADSEYMAGLLTREGHALSPVRSADVVIVNTCTVKSPTENKIRKRLDYFVKNGRRTVVSGCMPAASPGLSEEYPAFSFIGVNVGDIIHAVDAIEGGGRLVKIQPPGEKVLIPKVRRNDVVEILPVGEGCVGACSFCATKKARGTLVSYPERDIVRASSDAIKCGIKEIWLTGQDTGAYGIDTKTSLPTLIKRISALPGDFRLRVGMMNPDHALRNLDELLLAYENPNVYKFLHLPVQSGDNQILSDMRRRYTAEEFLTVVSAFRKKFDVTLSTDVIVGYPTEDEKAFKKTCELIRKTQPDIVNVSRFWRRPDTQAAKLKEHPGRITKDRSRRIQEFVDEAGMTRNKKWVGWTEESLVSERNKDGTYTARNDHYKPIIITSDSADLLGKRIKIEIKSANSFYLTGTIR
ncbi:tRNA-2-methylthio-N(6)-dimethylallyladenosine synthase [uncultured archaeon]|nr:tRNA-2-methylthio-N(6)-dimethylallyladenosine synthase [uncultured archaeon]